MSLDQIIFRMEHCTISLRQLYSYLETHPSLNPAARLEVNERLSYWHGEVQRMQVRLIQLGERL